jgi:hypothetical protein
MLLDFIRVSFDLELEFTGTPPTADFEIYYPLIFLD